VKYAVDHMTLQYAAGMLIIAAMILCGFLTADHFLNAKQRRRMEEWRRKTKTKDHDV